MVKKQEMSEQKQCKHNKSGRSNDKALQHWINSKCVATRTILIHKGRLAMYLKSKIVGAQSRVRAHVHPQLHELHLAL
jgi:hypothetical protein